MDVGDLMTTEVIAVGPETALEEAAQTMVDRDVGRLPVVDDAGRLVGIVTRSDLLRAFVGSGDSEDVPDGTRMEAPRRRPRHETDDVRAPSDPLPTFLETHHRAILAAAAAALTRQHMPHYSWDGDEAALKRLSALFEQLLCALSAHDLGPIVTYAERVAEERFSAGYDLSEVQVAFNALEETTWSCVLAELDAAQFAEAIGLISTALGAGKDALARRYVSLATDTHVSSLDVRALFEGSAEGVHVGQRLAIPTLSR